MRFRYITFAAVLLLAASNATAVTHTVTNSGFTFSPATLSINLGDTVVFSLDPAHNVVEVSQATWNSNGNTSNGGFILPSGGGSLVLTNTGTYYYVCQPHASMGMKGTITVTQTTLTTGMVSPTTVCRGGTLTVPFSITGSFNAGNQFSAQLSNASGNFSSPVVIGTLTGTAAGQIAGTIPQSAAAGTGYRIRVVSTNPAIIAADNGANITVLDAPAAAITAGGPTSFCEGGSVTLNATTGTGFSYTWRRNGSVISGAAGASYAASSAGSYTVEVSNGSCATLSAIERVVVYASDPTTLTWTGAQNADWGTVGNWDNPCAVPSAGDTVIIGSAVAPPSGIPGGTLARLSLNHPGGVTLNGDLAITGVLTLGNGCITLGSSNLSIAPGGSIAGTGAAGFVVTDGTGELRQASIGAGGRTGTILFPVGASSTEYTPLFLANTGTADEFRASVRSSVRDGGSAGTVIADHVVDRTWMLSEATPGGSNATLTVQWAAANELNSFDRTLCYLARHDGTAWGPVQGVGAATGSGPYTRTAGGLTAFSPIAVGDAASPLPVELRALNAEADGATVTLRWTTERETNSAGFGVERSAGAQGPWSSLTFVPSAGASVGPKQYRFTDQPPGSGTWRYRLRMTDLDGSMEYSPTVQATTAAPGVRLAIDAVYPDPVRLSQSAAATISFVAPRGGRVTLGVFDILGRRVATLLDGAVESGRRYSLRLEAAALPPGAYLCRLEQEGQSVTRRLTILR